MSVLAKMEANSVSEVVHKALIYQEAVVEAILAGKQVVIFDPKHPSMCEVLKIL